MKKLILLLVVIGFTTAGAFAQGVSGGIKAGLNLADQKISGGGISIDTKMKVGFHFGAYATIMFSDKLGIQPEALYSTQGSKVEFDGADGDFNFSYLNVPVLLRYNINDLVHLHAGPQFGFLLKAEADSDGDTEDIKDSFKGSDLGLAFGGGVDLPMGLGFGIRYTAGLSQISEDEDENGEWKNNNIQLYVSYKLFGAK